MGTNGRPFFASLDGLRCLAILPIVWHHSTTGPVAGPLGRGPLGVDLFFSVSGFLITSLLLHERRRGGIALGAFWIRRSLRIFPLYYLVLGAFVVHALAWRQPGPARDYFLESAPFYATYTSNWFLYKPVSHPIVFAFAWSLAAEEQFYLLWPPVLRLCRGVLGPAAFMALLIALDQAAERGLLDAVLHDGLAFRVLRSFATPIGLGSLLALAVDHPLTSPVVRTLLGQRASSTVALALVGAAVVVPWSILPTHVALTALVGACALRQDHFLAPMLENRLVRHIGIISYGMYLLNVPVVAATRTLLSLAVGPEVGAGAVFVVATVLSVVVATVVHRRVERPFLEMRNRFRDPSPTVYALPDAQALSAVPRGRDSICQ